MRLEPPRLTRGRAGCLAVQLVLIVALFLLARPLLEAYAGWWEVRDSEAATDLAVILDGGKGERLWKGLDLWQRGVAKRLLITGDADPVLPVYAGGPGITQAEAKREIAIRKGVPADSVEVLLGPTSTLEEARAVRRWCDGRTIRSITVVTSPFHTRRARAVFRHAFRKSGVRVMVDHAPWDVAGFSTHRWWTREKELMAVFDETVKTLYYAGEHKILPF
jgi:uncharacterized SAM-binding protein YcdF (DUF218 family)